MASTYQIRNFVMESGERYCLLVDTSSRLPLFYPNLFVTTQVRNRSLSLASMSATLGGIQVLLHFLKERKLDLVRRFLSREYLAPHELDAIRDYCQKRLCSPEPSGEGTALSRHRKHNRVAKETEYNRLTTIAEYLDWLAAELLSTRVDNHTRIQIARMVKGLKTRRPTRPGRSGNDRERGLTPEQVQLASELFDPYSANNPFRKDQAVRVRNHLIFQLLHYLGLRRGEVLNLQTVDLDLSSNTLKVLRRPDEKEDPRPRQGLVKTCERTLPLSPGLAKALHAYICNERRATPGASRHRFLFVTHKHGPTLGYPLSLSSYMRNFLVVRDAARRLQMDALSEVSLANLAGHQLRHTWNERFSVAMDTSERPVPIAEQEKYRSHVMGWFEGSGTAERYNRRFTKRKAMEVALRLQEGILKLPKEQADESESS